MIHPYVIYDKANTLTTIAILRIIVSDVIKMYIITRQCDIDTFYLDKTKPQQQFETMNLLDL